MWGIRWWLADRHGQSRFCSPRWRCSSAAIAVRASSPSTWAARCGPRSWPGRRALRPGHGWRKSPSSHWHASTARGYRTWAAVDQGRLLRRSERRGGRPRREGGYLVGAGKSRRGAGGAAHDDGAFRAVAIERCCGSAVALAPAVPTASCWTPTDTGWARPTCGRDGGADAQRGVAVLHYLFARFDEQRRGARAADPRRMAVPSMTRCLPRIRQWLKTLRKNVSVIFATQALPTSRIRASHPRSSKAARVGFLA